MSKTKIILLMVLFITISVFSSRLNANAETTGLQVLFSNNGNTLTTCNTIYANFKVINNGSSSINLADLKFRYYYTADSDKPQNFYCDHAGMLNGWSYTGVTDKVTGVFNRLSSPTQLANSYLEVGFKSDAGTLSAGGYIEIQTRVARNDYSFKTLSTYGENNKITAYIKGQLIYGMEAYMLTPTIMPTVVAHDKYVNSDVSITLTPNGNSFKGIVGLTEGKEYEVTGNTVKLMKEYLNSLPIGNVSLTFDFGATINPKLTLTVKGTTPKPLFDAMIGTATGIPGDTVTVPVTFKNVAKAGNVGVCNFYIGYDTSLLEAVSVAPGSIVPNAENNFSGQINSSNGEISFVFLDSTIGDEMIEADGDFAQVTFKIKPTATATTTPLEFIGKAYAIPGGIELMANTTNGSITIKNPEMVAPTITPSSASFIKALSSDIKVAITPNGNTFNGIIGLNKGTDYAVSGNTVTILKSYLNMLPAGTKTLTFDFGVADNPVLKIFIDVVCPCSASVRIGTVEGALGDTVTVPITVSSARHVGGIGTFNFYVGYDNTILEAVSVEPGNTIKNPTVNFSSKIYSNNGTISVVFLDNTLGDEIITSDGIIVNITFKVLKTVDTTIPIVFKNGGAFGDGNMTKISAISFTNGGVLRPITKMLNLSVGKVTGKEGEVVAVPISFANVAKMGNVMSCDFKVNYDTNLLEAISVEPGSIVTNAEANFRANINTTSGAISLFLNSTEESQYINEDGVFANIKFKLKTPTAAQIITPVEIKEIGAFSSTNLNQVPVYETNGSVTVIRTTILESKIDPSMTSFVLGGTDGLKITLSPNGNTFNGISELKSGTDYTVLGNTVTILNRYVNSLLVGTHKLTFDFGFGDKNPVLEIAVKAGTPTMTINYVEVYKNDPKDLYVIITPNGNSFNGIVGLKEGTDYTISGKTVIILKDYMAKLPLETIDLTFDFGIPVNPVLKICTVLGEQYPLNVKIGTVKGAQGDIVKVPVTLSHVKDVGNVGTFNFYVDYDKTLLKAVSVEPGDIITNPNINFSGKINATTGLISVVFLDNTIGDEIIKTDGIIANMTFNILGTSSTAVPIVFKEGGAFGNENMAKIKAISFTAGSVTIDDNSLKVSIGEATGKEGEIVKVPISFTNVANSGNIACCDFRVGYDTNLLEAVAVEPGSIVTNSEVNFGANIITTSGAISFLFVDYTSGSQPINNDGVFAYINFKLKTPAEAKITTPVTIKDIGAFGDPNLNTMPVSSIGGNVNIVRTTPLESKIKASTAYFKLGTPYFVIKVELTPNGNTFIGITGLTVGIDYTVSANTVTILNSYLNGLEAGNKKLVFDFGTGDKNPVLEITVSAGEPTISPNYNTVDKNNITNIVVNITPNGNSFKGILGLTEGSDYTVSGNTLTLLASYISNLEYGTKSFTVDFGLTKNPIFYVKIIDSSLDNALYLRVGTAAAISGDTVTIPVTFENVANVGDIATCNFYIKFDATKFEAVSALPGSIVINPAINFSSRIDSTKGTISFVFLDNTIGDELIEQDGVFANIKFRIRGSYSSTSPIIFAEGGAFGDANFSKIEKVMMEDGYIRTY